MPEHPTPAPWINVIANERFGCLISERGSGYIAGYVPGVRENGGQYTHAAIWLAWAYALLGDGGRLGALTALLNPLRHADANLDRYQVEPYVIAADVYASPTHLGRGGWTWYTGSAAWFYRLGVEMLLGLRRAGETLTLTPCIPPAWSGYTLRYRNGSSEYRIEVQNPHGASGRVVSLVVDGPGRDGWADSPDG